MSVIADTCVWTVYLNQSRSNRPESVSLLDRLVKANEVIYIPGLVYQEVLQGIKSPAVRDEVAQALQQFYWLDATADHFREAPELYCMAKSKGFSIGTIDCLIAAQCIATGSYLLTDDKDFDGLVKCSKLKLLPRISPHYSYFLAAGSRV